MIMSRKRMMRIMYIRRVNDNEQDEDEDGVKIRRGNEDEDDVKIRRGDHNEQDQQDEDDVRR